MLEVLYGHKISDIYESYKFGLFDAMNETPEGLDNFIKNKLDQGYIPISPEEIDNKDIINSEDKYFLLTFDDGYKDFLYNILPITKKYNIPVMFFIVSGIIKRKFIPYEHQIFEMVRLCDNINFQGQQYETKTINQKDLVYKKIRKSIITNKIKYKILAEILKENNIVDLSYLFDDFYLNEEELRQLSAEDSVYIGVHSENHSLLGKNLNFLDVYKDIKTSKDYLEDILGKDIQYMSYPYGNNNIIVRMLTKKLGFKYAFTTREKINDNYYSFNPFNIFRLDLNNNL